MPHRHVCPPGQARIDLALFGFDAAVIGNTLGAETDRFNVIARIPGHPAFQTQKRRARYGAAAERS